MKIQRYENMILIKQQAGILKNCGYKKLNKLIIKGKNESKHEVHHSVYNIFIVHCR